jgi:hypothetical protein
MYKTTGHKHNALGACLAMTHHRDPCDPDQALYLHPSASAPAKSRSYPSLMSPIPIPAMQPSRPGRGSGRYTALHSDGADWFNGERLVPLQPRDSGGMGRGGAVGLAWGNLVIGAGGGIWDLALDGGCWWWVRGWVAIESGVGVEGCGVCV